MLPGPTAPLPFCPFPPLNSSSRAEEPRGVSRSGGKGEAERAVPVAKLVPTNSGCLPGRISLGDGKGLFVILSLFLYFRYFA